MAGPLRILHPHLLLKNNLLHTGAGEALLAHAGAGEVQVGAVHDRAAEIVDGLLIHARACKEAAVYAGEDAEAVLVHVGAGGEVAEALLVHVGAGDEATVHDGASKVAEAGEGQ